jgi:protein-S-isoprenylcysteine O-methyltransferase Ste14
MKYFVGRFLFRYRWIIYIAVFVPMVLIHWHETIHWSTWLAGYVLLFFGAMIRIYSAFYIGWKGKPDDPLKRTLTTCGPYQYSRNPLYWGNILGFSGAALLFRLVWYVPIAAFVIFLIHHFLIIWYEEERMREKYGVAYESYTKLVPRWGPKLFGPVPCEPRQPFPWIRVFMAELGTIGGFVGTIILALVKANWIC